jgi:hypothetical protein
MFFRAQRSVHELRHVRVLRPGLVSNDLSDIVPIRRML